MVNYLKGQNSLVLLVVKIQQNEHNCPCEAIWRVSVQSESTLLEWKSWNMMGEGSWYPNWLGAACNDMW